MGVGQTTTCRDHAMAGAAVGLLNMGLVSKTAVEYPKLRR
jgi:hypothetical protein